MSHFYNPEPPRTRHLLIYLHGHGGRPDQLHPFVRDHHDDGIVRLCPAASIPADDGFSWFDSGPRGVDAASLQHSVAELTAVVEATRADLDLGWSDVVLGGFSQGAATAIALASSLGATWSSGEHLAGLLLQAGFVPEVFDDEVDLGRVAATAVLVQHGTDDDVVPAFMAKDLAEALTALPEIGDVEVDITIGGHVLSEAMLATAVRWLAER